ncbi:hypothetical protein ABT301_12160 [Streptomyces sp. NPDC000987]|uniref:hypothetical protein n=1 Tax=Streptomyces sp. NPDC000987 TaxID=3154374 RepID=UPI003329003A
MAKKRNKIARAGLAGKFRGAQRQRIMEAERLMMRGATESQSLSPVVVRGVAAFLANTGECRMARPFASLYPVFDENGLRYCCGHRPQHCTRPLGRREA